VKTVLYDQQEYIIHMLQTL